MAVLLVVVVAMDCMMVGWGMSVGVMGTKCK